MLDPTTGWYHYYNIISQDIQEYLLSTSCFIRW